MKQILMRVVREGRRHGRDSNGEERLSDGKEKEGAKIVEMGGNDI